MPVVPAAKARRKMGRMIRATDSRPLERDGRQRKDATGKAVYTPIVELKGKEQRERFQAAALGRGA